MDSTLTGNLNGFLFSESLVVRSIQESSAKPAMVTSNRSNMDKCSPAARDAPVQVEPSDALYQQLDLLSQQPDIARSNQGTLLTENFACWKVSRAESSGTNSTCAPFTDRLQSVRAVLWQQAHCIKHPNLQGKEPPKGDHALAEASPETDCSCRGEHAKCPAAQVSDL